MSETPATDSVASKLPFLRVLSMVVSSKLKRYVTKNIGSIVRYVMRVKRQKKLGKRERVNAWLLQFLGPVHWQRIS